MKKILLIFGFTIFLSICFTNSTHAQIVDKEYSRTYTIQDDHIQVQESKRIRITESGWFIAAGAEEVFTLFNPVKNDPEREQKLQKTKDSILVSDNFGNTLQYTTELTDNENIILRVKFALRVDSSIDYTINLNYNSYGLIIKSGKLRDAYIPSFSKDYQFTTETSVEHVNTTIKIPKNFGNINFVSPETQIQSENDFWIISFPQESLVGETGWIQIGTEQFYTFKITQPFTKTSEAPFINNRQKVLIPRNIKSGPIDQKVFFTNISPQPSNAFIDENGNIFLEFTIPSNESGTITIEGYARINQNNSIDFKNSGTLSQIPKEILEANTKPAEYWESDSPEIIETANTLKNQVPGNDKSVYELVNNTYKFVIDRIDYSEVKRFGINIRQGALATLQGGAAVCMEYSDLFIALMRAQGVPARGAFGYGYSALDSETEYQTINHQWAEVYIPSLGEWVSVDTTWGESGQELIGGDLNHFYTHVASVSPEIPSTTEVSFYGTLNEIPDKKMEVTAVENLPSENAMTQEQLIQTFQKESSFNIVEDILNKIRLVLFEFNRMIDQELHKLLPDSTQEGRNIIKLAPLAVLISIIVINTYLKRKRKPNTSVSALNF